MDNYVGSQLRLCTPAKALHSQEFVREGRTSCVIAWYKWTTEAGLADDEEAGTSLYLIAGDFVLH
jgi:hypothetical protein